MLYSEGYSEPWITLLDFNRYLSARATSEYYNSARCCDICTQQQNSERLFSSYIPQNSPIISYKLRRENEAPHCKMVVEAEMCSYRDYYYDSRLVYGGLISSGYTHLLPSVLGPISLQHRVEIWSQLLITWTLTGRLFLLLYVEVTVLATVASSELLSSHQAN